MKAKPATFSTCPGRAAELAALGALNTRETVAGVYFTGPRALAYRACLWSRLANRILWPLAEVDARDGDSLYQGLRAIDWGRLFTQHKSIAINFNHFRADRRFYRSRALAASNQRHFTDIRTGRKIREEDRFTANILLHNH